jgi:hypothetical protein
MTASGIARVLSYTIAAEAGDIAPTAWAVCPYL